MCKCVNTGGLNAETRSRQVQTGVLEHKCIKEHHIKTAAATTVRTINTKLM